MCMDSQKLPNEWGVAYITPVLKEGVCHVCNNYRGYQKPAFSRFYSRIIRDLTEKEYTDKQKNMVDFDPFSHKLTIFSV